jgi:glycosyltransferase involved in cell wall biosynthesis
MNGNNGVWPKISVVTPSLNQGQYIEATIESVLGQGYPNLEYIIIDGGSTDGTVGIIDRYSEHLANWVSEPDEGQTDALIKGFRQASGDILCWLCSDDLFEPGALREAAEIFAEHPDWQVIYGDSLWIDADSRPIRPKKEIPFIRFIWMYDHNYLPQPSTFWRRGIYEQVGGLDVRMELTMDADLWARFAERTTLYHVPRTWSRMRYYPEQKNRRLRAISDKEDVLIRSRYLPDEPPWLRRLKSFSAKSLRVALKLARGAYW